MFLSPIKSEPCKRCALQVNIREKECPHCIGLTDAEASLLKKKYKKKMLKLNSGLGSKFVFLSIFFGLLSLMFLLA